MKMKTYCVPYLSPIVFDKRQILSFMRYCIVNFAMASGKASAKRFSIDMPNPVTTRATCKRVVCMMASERRQ